LRAHVTHQVHIGLDGRCVEDEHVVTGAKGRLVGVGHEEREGVLHR
jgi:hypothetical protein